MHGLLVGRLNVQARRRKRIAAVEDAPRVEAPVVGTGAAAARPVQVKAGGGRASYQLCAFAFRPGCGIARLEAERSVQVGPVFTG